MRTLHAVAPLLPTSAQPNIRVAHAPVPGANWAVSATRDLPDASVEHHAIPARRIPDVVLAGLADVGIWWDSGPPTTAPSTVLATSDLVVVANDAAGLPRRPLMPSDLGGVPLVATSGLGRGLLDEVFRRMTAANQMLLLDDPTLLPTKTDRPAFGLFPGSPEILELGADLTILPLAEPIPCELILLGSVEADERSQTTESVA